jgi:hypothetical protein
VGVEAQVDGNAAQPEKDTAIHVGELLDSLGGAGEGGGQYIFGLLHLGQAGKNDPAVQAISVPGIEFGKCIALAVLEGLDDDLFALEGDEIIAGGLGGTADWILRTLIA